MLMSPSSRNFSIYFIHHYRSSIRTVSSAIFFYAMCNQKCFQIPINHLGWTVSITYLTILAAGCFYKTLRLWILTGFWMMVWVLWSFRKGRIVLFCVMLVFTCCPFRAHLSIHYSWTAFLPIDRNSKLSICIHKGFQLRK